MTLTLTCAKIAAMVSAMVVLVAVGLLVLMLFCVCLGAYESYTNPMTPAQEQQEYSNLSTQINTGASQIKNAVPAGAGP